MNWEITGIIAAVLTSFGFLPQVIKMLKTKSVNDVSVYALLQFMLGVILWALYGFYKKDLIIISANTVTLAIIIFALVLCIKYKKG